MNQRETSSHGSRFASPRARHDVPALAAVTAWSGGAALVAVAVCCTGPGVSAARAEAPPCVDPVTAGWSVRPGSGITNLYSPEMLLRCVGDGDANGLKIDLTAEPVLLDGTAIDPAHLMGTAWTAAWPLSGTRSDWDVYQFSSRASVRNGQAELSIAQLSNDDDPGWAERGQFLIRLDLALAQDGADRRLGTYEFLVGFHREERVYRRATTVTEGPYVALVCSDAPDRAVIVLSTEPAAPVRVRVRPVPPASLRGRTERGPWPRQGDREGVETEQVGRRTFASSEATHHEIAMTDLRPDTEYFYSVEVGGWTSTEYRFRTAPPMGQGTTRFAYAGDSRGGPGGGMRAFMGVNALVLEQEMNAAWRTGVRFWLHGGDLVSGYTSSPDDFRAQLRAFKWFATPLLRSIPFYTAIGNHDSVARFFAGADDQTAGLDRWPYATESSEAIFAQEFVQPWNGPVPSDPRRPPYQETAFSFSYGPVRIVVVNSNYWFSRDPVRFGGSPEGFIFPDQVAWLRAELDRADADPRVHHVFVCMHEPPFPNSAHQDDAMWYGGDLAMRACTVPAEGGEPHPEAAGVIETRNEVVRLAAASRKTVAILASDEHNYSRMLLTPQTPAGDPARDDPDGDGKLDLERLSPLPGLRRPLWLIISGGAGAPHYAEEASPWNRWWKASPDRCRHSDGCYRFSPLNHWVLFEDDGRRVALTCYSAAGDLLDEVDDLVEALR